MESAETKFEPWTTTGDYDDEGRWHPRWLDDRGQWNPGWGWFDEDEEWQVEHGHFSPDGEWIAEPAAPVIRPHPIFDRDDFFHQTDGDTLEVVFIWCNQVISVTPFRPTRLDRALHVGPSSDDDFVLDDIGFDGSIPLVRQLEDGTWLIMISDEMDLRFQGRDADRTLEELVDDGLVTQVTDKWCELELRPGSGLEIDLNDYTFLIRFSDPMFLSGPGVDRIDRDTIPFIGISGLIHVVALLLVMTMPDGARALELDGYQPNDRFAQMSLTELQEEDPIEAGFADDGEPAPEAAGHTGEEGEAGDPDETTTDRRMAVKGPAENEDLELARERAQEIAKNSGIAPQLKSIHGMADRSIGEDAEDALGKLRGDEVGGSSGMRGLGIRGTGRGGPGDSERGIGMGDVETDHLRGVKNGCRGEDCGKGYGNGAQLGERDPEVPETTVIPGRANMTGALDREIIKRVVRQHKNELQYCYETELQKNPKLAGQLNVEFHISGDGTVISAIHQGGTLQSHAVASCVTRKIQRWHFPAQVGNGGIVVVKYPFRFTKG